jgi:hypothetical protein
MPRLNISTLPPAVRGKIVEVRRAAIMAELAELMTLPAEVVIVNAILAARDRLSGLNQSERDLLEAEARKHQQMLEDAQTDAWDHAPFRLEDVE